MQLANCIDYYRFTAGVTSEAVYHIPPASLNKLIHETLTGSSPSESAAVKIIKLQAMLFVPFEPPPDKGAQDHVQQVQSGSRLHDWTCSMAGLLLMSCECQDTQSSCTTDAGMDNITAYTQAVLLMLCLQWESRGGTTGCYHAMKLESCS